MIFYSFAEAYNGFSKRSIMDQNTCFNGKDDPIFCNECVSETILDVSIHYEN